MSKISIIGAGDLGEQIAKVATGAGTVVVKSISESGLYVGNPARKIR